MRSMLVVPVLLLALPACLFSSHDPEDVCVGSLGEGGCGPEGASCTFVIDTVDEPAPSPEGTMLVRDADGVAHVAWAIAGDENYTFSVLRHAWNDGDGWQVEVVEEQPQIHGVALAAGSDGTLAIAYEANTASEGDSAELRLATSDGDGWTFETVDPGLGTPSPGGLAIDDDGHVHLAYDFMPNFAADQSDSLRYATNASGFWTFEDIASQFNMGSYLPSLALDDGGSVHIAYTLALESSVVHVLRTVSEDGSAISYDYTTIGAGDGLNVRLVIDGAGAAHVAFSDADHLVNHATDASGEWASEIVDDSPADTSALGLAVDAVGAVSIAYGDQAANRARFATDSSGDWTVETFEEWACPRGTSIAIDGDGRPEVAYSVVCGEDNTAGRVRRAVRVCE